MGAANVKGEARTLHETAACKVQYNKEEGPFWNSATDALAKIQFAEEGAASKATCPTTTIPEVFKMAVKNHPDKTALRVERGLPPVEGKVVPPGLPLDQWKSWTFQEYYDESANIAKSMLHSGCSQHSTAAIFGFNSPEWFMSEMGAIMAGCKAAGIYPTDTPDQIQFKMRHSSSEIVFLEDAGKLDKIKGIAKDLPDLKVVVTWGEGLTPPASIPGAKGDIPCYDWAAFLALTTDGPADALTARQAEIKPGHCCALIYTSGTTGEPKAVMISHDCLAFEAYSACGLLAELYQETQEERVISYLPLSHVAGMLVDIINPLVLTAIGPSWTSVSFARPYDLKLGAIGDRLRAVRPTMFLGVPRVWEKIAEKMQAVGASITGFKKTLSTWAKGLGKEHAKECQLGKSGAKPWGYSLASGLIHKKAKAALGLEGCKFAFTGAAPITTETLEYFGQLGIQINEVYGMSENCGAATFSTDDCHVWGSCGWALPGTEVKILSVGESINDTAEVAPAKDIFNATEEEQGELCFRGRHIMMGYLANPDLGEEHVEAIKKKNAGAIDDNGWLHSGDKGAMDARGMFKITGRYKELIIGSGGENIAPVPIEDNIKKLSPAISNVMMVGDKRKFNVALVTLKAFGTGELSGGNELEGPALKISDGITTISGACKDETFIKHVTDTIIATNNDGAVTTINAAKIQKFTILPADFSVTDGDLTATLKTKRSVIEAKYASTIEKMYASKDTFVECDCPYQE